MQAVSSMFDARLGYLDIASQHIDIVQDPAVEGGVRYVDRSDGEDLAQYGTVCTKCGSSLSDPCTAAEARMLEFSAFYDGLRDPAAHDQEQHRARARVVYKVLQYVVKAQLGDDATSWGEEWDKLRNAADLAKWRALVGDERQGRSIAALRGLGRGLVRAVTPRSEGLSCITQLPSAGRTQVYEVRHWGRATENVCMCAMGDWSREPCCMAPRLHEKAQRIQFSLGTVCYYPGGVATKFFLAPTHGSGMATSCLPRCPPLPSH